MNSILKKILKKYYKHIITIIVLQILISLFGIIIPYLNGRFIDILLLARTFKDIKTFLVIVVVISVTNIILSFLGKKIVLFTKNIMSYNMVKEILMHLQMLPIEIFEKYAPTYLSQRVKGDSDTIVNFVIDNMISIVVNALSAIGIVFILGSVNKVLLLITFVFIPLYCCMYIILKKPLYHSNLSTVESANKYIDKLNSLYIRNRYIKVRNHFRIEFEKLKFTYRNYLDSFMDYTVKTLGFSASDSFISLLFQIAVFIYGGKEVIADNMSIGEFSIMNTYFTILLNLVKYYFELGQSYQTFKVASKRNSELLDLPCENNGDLLLDEIKSIEVNQFNYSYFGKKVYQKGMDIKFEKPGLYAICGKNGMGKTTLILSVIGINSIGKEGDITFNGTSIEKCDMYSLRDKHISVMLQNEKLPDVKVSEFIDSLIGMGKFKSIISEEVCKRVFVNELFDIMSIIDNRIIELSSGEKQFLLFFVTLHKNADVYIFDEPTSNLHSELIDKVLYALNELVKKGKIVIVISHESTVIRRCEKVYYL